MFGYRQLEVTTGEWWAGLVEWVIKASVLVAAITLLLRTPFVARVVFRFGHWLWNFPLIAMTVEGLRELVRDEVTPVAEKVDSVGRDVCDLRVENADQHAQVTVQLAKLSETVDEQNVRIESHSKRLAAVESAFMNRWRRGE